MKKKKLTIYISDETDRLMNETIHMIYSRTRKRVTKSGLVEKLIDRFNELEGEDFV